MTTKQPPTLVRWRLLLPVEVCFLFLFLSHMLVSAQTVIAWGSNSHGQTNVPATATNVIAVAAGRLVSLALRSDGSLVAWGYSTNVPPAATNITAIAIGDYDIPVALRSDGSVLIWSSATNAYVSQSNIVAIAAGDFQSLALRNDGNVISLQGNQPLPSSLSNVVALSVGAVHSLALRDDGGIVSWGLSSPYPTGTLIPPPTSLANVVGIYAGATHNVGLDSLGRLRVWGRGHHPAVPASATNIVTAVARTNCYLALRSDGKLIVWGGSAFGGSITNVPASATNVTAMALGHTHGLAVIGERRPVVYETPKLRISASLGDTLPLRARVVGEPPLSFQWFADGTPIPGATNETPEIPAILGEDNIGYHFVVSNAWGCVTSSISKSTILPVKVWGDHIRGERNVPLSLTNPVAVAAGAFHALGLKADGTVVAWGKNSDQRTAIPPSATNVAAIAAGSDHSLALRADGSAVAWGRNWDGQTNIPSAATNVAAIAAGWAHSLVLRADGTVVVWGNNEYGQTNAPPNLKDVSAIASGYYHSLALKSDGRVIAWGEGEDYLVPANVSNIVAIAAGWEHSLALRPDGSVIAWGDNTFGQCNVPSAATNIVALAAGWYHSMVLRSDGAVITWGSGTFGVTNVPVGLTNAISIACGENFSMALVKTGPPTFRSPLIPVKARVGGRTLLTTSWSGTLPLTGQWFHNGSPIDGATNRFLWLDNVQPSSGGTYSLIVTNGAGETNSYTVNVNVEAAPYIVNATEKIIVPPWRPFSLTVMTQGSAPDFYQWRLNGTNLINGGRISGAHSAILKINTAEFEDSGIYELVASNAFGATTGAVWRVTVSPILAWGDNVSGQLEVPLETREIIAISAGGKHSLAVTADGNVIAWGDNTYGQTNVPVTATNVIAVSAGVEHNLALRSDNTLVAWGNNLWGRCDVPASATNIIAVAAGLSSFALRSNGIVLKWPGNPFSPPSNVVAIATERWSLLTLQADGSLILPGYYLPDATNLIAIAGSQPVLGLRADGTIYEVRWFPTPVPNEATNIIAIDGGWGHSLALRSDGRVFAWGDLYDGQTFVPDQARNLTAVSAGDFHSLALARVSPELAIAQQPENQSLFAGEDAVFSVEASGRGPLSYQWNFNGHPIPNATNTTITIPNVLPADTGIYTIIVSNPYSNIVSGPISLNVRSLLEAIRLNPGELLLRWPVSATNLVLQQTDALSSTPVWSDVPTEPASEGGFNSVTIPVESTQRFFRLKNN